MRENSGTIIGKAKRAIEYANDYRTILIAETETEKLLRSWSSFLEQYSTAVGAMYRAANKGPSKAWADSLLSEQRKDPRLQYAYQYWNSNKHVHEREETVEPRSVVLSGAVSLSGTFKRVIMEGNVARKADGTLINLDPIDVTVCDGKVTSGTFTEGSVVEQDHYVEIEPILNRGTLYDVPNKDIPPNDRAVDIANYICIWLDKKYIEIVDLEKR